MALFLNMFANRNFRSVVVAVSLVLCTAVQTQAKNKNEPWKNRIDTEETEFFLNKLAHQPELICIPYLHYFIGRPENTPANRFSSTKHYAWYRPNRNGLKYELVQEEAQPGRITQSLLTFHADDLNLDLQKVEGKYGKAPRKFFDQSTAPTVEYSFAPNTVMTFTQNHNTFRVGRVQIIYKGDPLPPPSMEDMAAAQMQRKGLAIGHLQNGRYRESIAALSEHLGENPEDVEAHLALAQAFKANCQINEAIAQYRYTLANAGNFPAVRDQCVKDLQALKVLPSVPADTEIQTHNVSLRHKGQHLKRGGLQDSKKMQGDGTGFNVQPLDPKAANTPIIGEPPVAPTYRPSDVTAGQPLPGAPAADIPMQLPPVGTGGVPQQNSTAGPEPF